MIALAVIRLSPNGEDIAWVKYLTLDPELHRDAGQRLAGCRANDSTSAPGGPA